MRDYQQAAIELGFLHHRCLRGTAPADCAARGAGLRRAHPAPSGPRSPSPDRWCPHDEHPSHSQEHVDPATTPDARRRWCSCARRSQAGDAAARPARHRRRCAPARAGDGRPARGLRHPAPDDPRRAAARRRRRLDRRRQVDAGQLAGRRAGDRARRAAARRPGRRCWCTTPTTRHWFGQDRLLPDLVRVDHTTDDPDALQLVAADSVPRGAGDPRRPRRRLGRGAQPACWPPSCWPRPTCGCSSPRPRATPTRCRGTTCKQAAERSTAVAIVLDRTPARPSQTVSTHLARMLASRGLKDSPLFIVTEGTVDEDGLLPADYVAEIRGWLESLAADADARAGRGPADARGRRPHPGPPHPPGRRRRGRADARPPAAARRRRRGVRRGGRRGHRRATADGTLLRGEVLARWQEFVGTGELLRTLEAKVGRLRDRLVNAIKGKPQQAERVTVAVESGLETLVLEHAEAAAERAEAAWQQQPAGPALLADGTRATSAAPRATCGARPSASVRDWQQDVLEMVRTEGADKRTTARFLAYGVNGLSVALMVVVFAHTAGVTGAEVGIAGGTAVLGQKLLEAVFGDQAVRTLAERARRTLEQRVTRAAGRRAGPLPRPASTALGLDAERGRAAARAPRAGSTTCATRRRCAPTRRERRHPCERTDCDVPARRRQEAGRRAAPTSAPGSRLEAAAAAGPRPARRRGRRRRRGGRRRGPPAGSGCRPTTRSSRSPAPPGRASPRRSTRSPGSSCPSVGVRRPTTSWATACVWGSDGADELLEWLGIPPRHQTMRDSMLDTAADGGPRRSTASSCWTCPTTTPPRSPTTSRSTGWSSSPTCWSGCSTRRSTPTPRSTTATSRRWRATPA